MNMKLCTASAIAYMVNSGPIQARAIAAELMAVVQPGADNHPIPGWNGIELHRFRDHSYLIIGMNATLPDGGAFDCIAAIVSDTETPLNFSSAMHAAQIEIWNAAQKAMMERTTRA